MNCQISENNLENEAVEAVCEEEFEKYKLEALPSIPLDSLLLSHTCNPLSTMFGVRKFPLRAIQVSAEHLPYQSRLLCRLNVISYQIDRNLPMFSRTCRVSRGHGGASLPVCSSA